jgi:RNA polymerase primary sigma factor
MPDSEQESLRSYIRDIKKYPQLTPQEEKKLGRLSIKGNEEAIEKLVNSNLLLVIHIAKRYKNKGMDFLDLISEGNIGLMKAAARWDRTRKTRFTTYAGIWIKQQIRAAMTEKIGQVKLPMNLNRASNSFYHKLNRLQMENGGIVSPEAIKKKFGDVYQTKRIDDILERLSISFSSVDCTSQNFTSGRGIKRGLELITPSFEKKLETTDSLKQLNKTINRMLDKLNEREKTVIINRYGLNGKNPQNLSEIGKNLGISCERVRQNHEAAINKLKHQQHFYQLKEYLNA